MNILERQIAREWRKSQPVLVRLMLLAFPKAMKSVGRAAAKRMYERGHINPVILHELHETINEMAGE